MYQQEFKFFWPLTEQNNLDLDFAPCHEYEEQKRQELARSSVVSNNSLLTGGTGITAPTWAVADPTYGKFQVLPEGAVGFWAVTPNMSVGRKTKPKLLHRMFTKLLLGWEWKDK